jgi:glycosyltransferase involved in cell wall biosynthesis
MRYLIVLTAGGRRLSPTTFACESAFAEHLRSLKAELGARFHELVVAMAEMTAEQHREQRSGMAVIDEEREKIFFEPLFPWRSSRKEFTLGAPRMTAKLLGLVRDAALVHSHLSYDLWRPVELTATLAAAAMKKRVIAITDMDNRRDAEMNRRLGRWSTRSYLFARYFYDPLRDVQQRAYVKLCDLVLFKEPQQVADYGRGAPHVRLFLDPNFTRDQIAPPEVIEEKARRLADPSAPLRVLYFGRLVSYKGVDRMIEAVAIAHAAGARLTFDVMGAGDDEARLRSLVRARGIEDIVRWIEPRPYGPSFFQVLRERDLLLACPLAADTPRSTWDALASGMPILAFATPFYSGIGALTGAVDLVPWPEVAPLAARLAELAADKTALIARMKSGVEAAQANCGEDWLRRRVAWLDELFRSEESAPGFEGRAPSARGAAQPLIRPSGSA